MKIFFTALSEELTAKFCNYWMDRPENNIAIKGKLPDDFGYVKRKINFEVKVT